MGALTLLPPTLLGPTAFTSSRPYLIISIIMADAHVETSDLNQDSLDGNSASNSEVGSQESSPEIVASNEVITPTLSTGTDEDSGASAEVTEAVPAAAASAPAEESREAEGATEDAAKKARREWHQRRQRRERQKRQQ